MSSQLSFPDMGNLASEFSNSTIRSLVPLVHKQKVTYLNSAMLYPLSNHIHTAVTTFLSLAQTHLNPKSIWQSKTEATRKQLGDFLNVPASSLSFTRDTTEGMNLFQRSLPLFPGANVCILDVEHPNQVYGWLALRSLGLEVVLVPTTEDTVADASTFLPFVNKQTIAIGISSVMFQSGTLNDVRNICAEFRPRGIHVLLDITQQIGVMPIDLNEIGASAAAFSCHKALGIPTGLGVLYIDPQTLPLLTSIPPIVSTEAIANPATGLVVDTKTEVRYHDSARRYEHQNPAFLQIWALSASLRFLTGEAPVIRVEAHLRALGRELMHAMEKEGVEVVGGKEVGSMAPHIYVVRLMHPQWKSHLIGEGIAVAYRQLGIRVSFGWYNDVSDIGKFTESLREGVRRGIPLA